MRRFINITLRIITALLILLLIVCVLFTFPKVQTRVAKRVSKYINHKYDTDISIKKVDFSYLGQIKFKEVYIQDSRKDTIIFVDDIKTSLLSFNKVLKGKMTLGNVFLSDATVVMRTYKGNNEDELQKFIKKFNKKRKKKKSSQFRLTTEQVNLMNGKFKLINENKKETPIVTYEAISGDVYNFRIKGTDIYGSVRNLQFVDGNGLEVENMETDYTYTKTYMHLLNTKVKTLSSEVETDIRMTYQEGDLKDFNNKVQIEADIPKATVSLKDIKGFYDELGTKDIISFSTKVKGTLNDFVTEKLKLISNQGSKVYGNIRFIKSFDSGKDFQLVANIRHLESDYNSLKNLLPNILGKTLPESFRQLGHFSMSGKSHITTDFIDAKLNIKSDIGKIQSDLLIKNFDNINRATYQGNVVLKDIQLGKLINNPLVGNFSMEADVVGEGFTLENLNTQVKGVVTKHQYKGYTYKNINVEGNVKDKLFFGKIEADDPNLKFEFEGLADLSKEKYKFNFISHVDYTDFNKLNLFKRDSIAVLKGTIKIEMLGNTLENMVGSIQFNNATYTNQIQDYHFKDFNITATIKDSIQTLKINSTDIINGQMKGRFIYKELPKLAQNAFGSIYTNYKPYKVSPKQSIDFRFRIYNQAVAVFFPELTFGTNTTIRGRVNSDKNLFQLTFKAPEVLVYDNFIEKVRLQIDNKNPIFNTQLSAKKIETNYYDIADIELVNITLNDSLYFRTEFKGGSQLKDTYSLAFYHTIDNNNRSILGFQKSNITFNNTEWKLNPNNNSKNKIIYDNITGEIDYRDFMLASGEQELLFYGMQRGKNYQEYNIDLERIDLSEIMPDIENFDFEGLINGGIWIERRNGILIPTADVQVIDLSVNDVLQGDLIGEIKGDNSNKKYQIDVFLEKDEAKSIVAEGNLNFETKEPMIDLDIDFNSFKLSILNAIAKGVMTDIRGEVSGKAHLLGLLSNPNFEGILSLNNSGVFFPYINVDYAFADNSKVALNNQSFVINDAKVYDTLFETTATLSGNISHNYFKKWYIDLQIDTDNLLAINTPEEENALFYGTGYLKGSATFKGYTNNINIAIHGSSNPGTEIIIPMSDLKTVESSKLIHFKAPKSDEEKIENSLRKKISDLSNGLTMDFTLEITKDATIKIVIDQSTGSFLQGNGTGTIQMYIDTKGTFNMFGDYIVNKGFYNFKYGGVINKPFIVKKGGSITFRGDPYKAELDIEAVYSTKANPQAILSGYESNRQISVDLITKLTGELFDSKQEFDIRIPNASIDLRSELDFVLNDNDTGNMMTQFISLLVTSSFYDEDNRLTYTGSSLGSEGLNSVASLVSSALLNILSDPDDKIQFGFDYTQGNKIIDTENQLGLSIATRLGKKEKIIINGEVNVPTGSQSNAHIAGNVSVEMPLNRKETLMMKVFNRQNDIQYTEQEEGYTQGMGLSWQVNFDNGKELLTKMGLIREDQLMPKKDSISKKQLFFFKTRKSTNTDANQN